MTMMTDDSMNESLANLVATIESVAAGDTLTVDDNHDAHLYTSEMLGGAVLHLSNGQSINVLQMSGSLDDTINVVQVETTDLGDHITTMDELCAIDIDTEKHILSETGAHVVVNTETEVVGNTHVVQGGLHSGDKPSVVLPNIPFSFPGQTFDTKCQKLILNVWDFFRRLKKNPDILDEIRTPQERAAAALHISAATIGKIGKNFKRTGKLEAPGKQRKRAKPVVDSVNAEHEKVIRNIIKEFRDSRVTPTLPLLLNECRERINFQGGSTSFRRILQRMGYKGLTTSMKAANAASQSANKTKTVSSSNPIPTSPKSSQTQKQSLPPPAEMIKSEVPVSIDPGFLSIPLTTPVASPAKKVSFRAVIPSSSPSISLPGRMDSSFLSPNLSSRLVSNLLAGNFVQLGTTSKGDSISLSQQAASAIASATARVGEGPQTIHVLQPDNTIQQIQILYTNINT